jgi:hypothetical protein
MKVKNFLPVTTENLILKISDYCGPILHVVLLDLWCSGWKTFWKIVFPSYVKKWGVYLLRFVQ